MNPKNKRKILNKKRIVIIFVVFVISITIIFSSIYTNYIKKITYENIYQNITELSKQTATQLNLSISNQIQFVNIVIDFINKGYANSFEEVFNRFNSDLKNYNFTRLVILDELGNGLTSDGKKVYGYENMHEFFSEDEVYLSENRPSTVSNNQVNIYSKTFIWQGKKMVLFATINTEDYKNILSRRLFNGKGGTYLINNLGTVLIDSFEKITEPNTNIYEYLQKNMNLKRNNDQYKIEKMTNDIKENKNGTIDINFDNQKIFIHYEKLEKNNWYVLSLAPDNTIANELSIFIGLSLSLCFLINLIIIIFFVFIYLLNKRKNKKLYEIAYIDPITKLGNETYFKENVSNILDNSEKNDYVMILDINKFKAYNKQYNYDFCNKILKEFGNIIKNNLPDKNITCRLSRDVFAAYFNYNGNIRRLVNKITIETSKMNIEDKEIFVNISIGIYPINKNDSDINEVLDKAYMAHAEIKGLYNDNCFIFDDSLEERFIEEQKIESEMEFALKNNEFKVVYQPKINTKNESIAGAEALVRWQKNDDLIPPSKFIPIFEKNKFINKLDLYVFEKVCQDIVFWEKNYGEVPVISVNVSKEHFIEENFIDKYVEITDKYKIDRKKIDLEVTESATLDDILDLNKILSKVKDKGFIISLDDFGTGYSSLSMLQNLPIDILKIDKTFINNANLKSNENMINYIIFMAKKLKVKTVVEGVETKEQMEFVKKLKCDMIQGFYYSKPISKQDFEKFLSNKKEL